MSLKPCNILCIPQLCLGLSGHGEIFFSITNIVPLDHKNNANPVGKSVRELPKNNLRILFALLPVFYVVTTGT
jgi:hypothetical protein